MTDPRTLLGFGPVTAGPIPPAAPGFPPPPRRPDPQRQGQRITPQFQTLRQALERERLELAQATSASDPELVVVFDLVGTVEGFVRAVRDIEGLEFLADVAADGAEPDDDFFLEEDGVRKADLLPQSLYMLMTNARAVGQIVRLFNLWRDDPGITFETGLNPLKKVFELLRAVRRWGPEDRVRETGLLEQWREDVALVGQQGTSRVEVELWFRDSADQRLLAEQAVIDVVRRSGGTILKSAAIEGIRYHALLADVPTHEVEAVVRDGPDAIELLTTETVMFVSPSLPMAFEMPEATDGPVPLIDDLPQGRPRVALLDGLPMSNHALLEGRITIDDPDDVAASYSAAAQLHGTAMASLILHGDLSNPGSPLASPVYVRPVLTPHPVFARQERTPPDELLVDLVDRCFHRMMEGDGASPPAAPSVRVVNLSIGDPARVFARQLSPLAKLLDWYAHRFNLLIIVSGGNHQRGLTLDAEDLAGDQAGARAAAARSSFADARNRRLLSPAESVNALTVGALHSDEWPDEVPDTVLELSEVGLPAGYSPVGHGFRRAIKPEILLPGGRQLHVRPPSSHSGEVLVTPAVTSAAGPGIRAAAPGAGGDRSATSYS